MRTALYINGIFSSVLEEICKAQKRRPGITCYLQPYSAKRITLLSDSPPTRESPVTLYASLTDSLSVVSYRARIVGWADKRKLLPDELERLNAIIQDNQQGEKEIYLTAGKDRPCVNLISIVDLAKFQTPIPVSCFIKAGDRKGLKERSRAGGWAYVEEQPEWLGTQEAVVAEKLEQDFQGAVRQALQQSSKRRMERLRVATRQPESVQVISRAFRRNPDVAAEVLFRANGICGRCKSKAPFSRKKDGTPYLEVHHKTTLAAGGEDTVENALALCPNCHRYYHFGV